MRDAALRAAMADPTVGVILLDLVLGTGAHADPAGHLHEIIMDEMNPGPFNLPIFVVSVTGAKGDPQGLQAQAGKLSTFAIVCSSNADAAATALICSKGKS